MAAAVSAVDSLVVVEEMTVESVGRRAAAAAAANAGTVLAAAVIDIPDH